MWKDGSRLNASLVFYSFTPFYCSTFMFISLLFALLVEYCLRNRTRITIITVLFLSEHIHKRKNVYVKKKYRKEIECFLLSRVSPVICMQVLHYTVYDVAAVAMLIAVFAVCDCHCVGSCVLCSLCFREHSFSRCEC